MYMGPSYGSCLGTMPPTARSTLMAVVVVSCNLVGAGLGPQIVGTLSDLLQARGDPLALSHALVVIVLFAAVPTGLFLRAARAAAAEAPRAAMAS
jgi:hypothetical protein